MSNSKELPDDLEIEINQGVIDEHRTIGIGFMGPQSAHLSPIALGLEPPLVGPSPGLMADRLLKKFVGSQPSSGQEDMSRSLEEEKPVKDNNDLAGRQAVTETVRAFLEEDPLGIVLRNEKLAVIVWLLSEEGCPLVVPLAYFSLYGEMSGEEAKRSVSCLLDLGILEERGSAQERMVARYSLSKKGRGIAKAMHNSS